MIFNNLLKIILIIFSVLYVGLEVLKYDLEALALSGVLILLLAYYYTRTVKKTNLIFFWFLIINGIAHVLDFLSFYIPIYEGDIDYLYYPISILYIVSYVFLIVLLSKTLSLKKILSKYYITIGVLLVLNVFSVTLISETTAYALTQGENIIEFIYSAVVMFLLSIALINYMEKSDNKSMLFLVASIFIFFSEMIQLAYIYIADTTALAAFYSSTMVLGFLCFYIQSQFGFSDQKDYYSGDKKISI